MAMNFSNLNNLSNSYGPSLKNDLTYIFNKIDSETKDKKLSRTEISNFFSQYGIDNTLANSLTDSIFNKYDNKTDNFIDINELTSSAVSFDQDKNKILDANETVTWVNSLIDDESKASEIGSQEWFNKQFDNAVNNNYSRRGYVLKYQDIFKNMDSDKDGKLNDTEITNYFNNFNTKSFTFSDKIAEGFKGFDVNKDGIDVNDFALIQQVFDQNKNVNLSIDEENTMFSFMTDNLDEAEEASRIINFTQQGLASLKSMDKASIDSNEDGILDSTDGLVSVEEYKAAFKKSFLSPDLVDKLFADYDKDNDGNLNLQELTQILLKTDSDNDGTIQFTETANFYNNLYKTDANVPDLANIKKLTSELNEDGTDKTVDQLNTEATQFNRLYGQYSNFIKQINFNKTDISNVDFKNYLANLGLTSDQADAVFNKINLKSDGTVDADTSFDSSNFDNFLKSINTDKKVNYDSFKAAFAGAGLSEEQTKALFNKFSSNGSLITSKAFNNVRIETNQKVDISKSDFTNYYEQKGFSTDLAEKLFEMFDNNSDGKVNVLELVNKGLEWDTAKTGKMDLNFEKNMYHDLTEKAYGTGKGLTFSNITSQKQLGNLISSMGSFIKILDKTTNSDNLISKDEYLNSLSLSGITDQKIIDNFYNYLTNKGNAATTNGVANIDVLNLIDSMSASDMNSDGNIDDNEKANFYRNFSNDETAIKKTVLHDSLLKSFNNSLKSLDTNRDGYINQSEYAKVIKSDYMAGQLASKYGSITVNGEKSFQLQDLINITATMDENFDGKQTVEELMSFYTDLSDGKLDKLNTFDNKAQYQNLNKTYSQMITSSDTKDANGVKDGQLNLEEVKNYLKSQNVPEYFAEEMINKYDKSGDGKLDIYELLNMGFELNTARVKSYKEDSSITEQKEGYDEIVMDEVIDIIENTGDTEFITKEKYKAYLITKGKSETDAASEADSLFLPYDEDTTTDKASITDAITSVGGTNITKEKYTNYLVNVKKLSQESATNSANLLFNKYDEDKDGILNSDIKPVLSTFEILKKTIEEFEREEKVNTLEGDEKEEALSSFTATDTKEITDVLKSMDNLGNKDGKISKEEYDNYINSFSEAPRWLLASRDNVFNNSIDINNDNVLDTKELVKASFELYKSKITKKTGILNIKETMTMYDKLSDNKTSVSGRKLNLGNIVNANQYKNLMTKYTNILKMFNNDSEKGSLTKAEFDTYKKTIGYGDKNTDVVFNKYDINRDGKLDLPELLNIGISLDESKINDDVTEEDPDGIIDSEEEANMF